MSKFSAIFAIIFSCLLINVHSAGTLAVSSTDGASASVYPVSVTKTGQAAVSVTATPSTTVTAPTDGAVVANIYTARWTNGLPLQQSWTLTADSVAGTVSAIGATVAITTGPQVSLTVTNTPPATVTAGTAQANAAAVLPTTTTNCGNYFIDCISGTITIQLYVPSTVSAACVVSITQVAAIAGILQYTTASVPTTTTVATAVTAANAATGAATTICGTATSGTTNTLYYFISTFGSATGTAQTTAFTNVRTAAAAGNLAGNTAYSVANLQPTIVGTVNAPSASAASLSTISKSANKLVVFAGVLTTMVATLFGFAF